MNLYDIPSYMEDVNFVGKLDLPWEQLEDKTVLLSGATGMIGSFLVDVLMEKNKREGLNCTIYALGRNQEKASVRFPRYHDDKLFHFICHDVQSPLTLAVVEDAAYVFHLASNTHPIQYSTEPIDTILTNVVGAQNMLDFATRRHASRFLFASSVEIYGENRGDVELFDEDYCGNIDCNTLRAGYPESKRCGEALCQAYLKQHDLDFVIARIARCYGPTMSFSDTKAASQFIKNAVAGENIVLKSAGTQVFSYTYVADAVSGLLTVLLRGQKGEAYNVADPSSDVALKELAKIIADKTGNETVFDVPKDEEAAGYSKATKARMNGRKLMDVGWSPRYNIRSGLERTIDILREVGGSGFVSH